MMTTYKGLELDAFQRDAIEAIEQGLSVVVAAPTGCGKTLVAEYAIERALLSGERVVYTAPIKALSNQKFRDFGALYGERVGIMTGDVTINPTADAMIMTTEIFRNTIFDNPAKLKGIRYVILDEAHFLDDPERGTVWEESIIFAPPEIRFIALSATISNLRQFASWIKKIREGGLRVVLETRRPVPLHMHVFTGKELLELDQVKGKGFPRGEAHEDRRQGRGRGRKGRLREEEGGRARRGAMSPAQQVFRLLDQVTEADHLPCIVFLFSREMCEKMAFACANRELLSRDEGLRLETFWRETLAAFGLSKSPAAQRLEKIILRGIAFHHAGMLPSLKEVVERLFTTGFVKLLFATETFALGVNMPARAVVFESLKKFDGEKRDYMKTRDFLQMAGRAGRRGKDDEGFVYACVVPETERPPDVRRVMTGEVEAVESQFNLAYATLLSLYAHLGDGLYTACERSFVHWKHKDKKGSPYQDMVSQVKRRIRLLTDAGYLRGQTLTEKGRFASLVYGYEIQAAELWASGLLKTLGAQELCIVVVALAYEAKRDQWHVPLAKHILEPLRRPVRDFVDAFRDREQSYRISSLTKRPDWSLSRAVWEWTRGASFASLADWAECPPGDIVRAFRMGIQILRQIAKPLRFLPEDTRELKARLREAARLMKRDEVDAEHALKQAIAVEAGEEAAARIPAEVDVADEGAEGDPMLGHVITQAAGTSAEDDGEDAAREEARPSAEGDISDGEEYEDDGDEEDDDGAGAGGDERDGDPTPARDRRPAQPILRPSVASRPEPRAEPAHHLPTTSLDETRDDLAAARARPGDPSEADESRRAWVDIRARTAARKAKRGERPPSPAEPSPEDEPWAGAEGLLEVPDAATRALEPADDDEDPVALDLDNGEVPHVGDPGAGREQPRDDSQAAPRTAPTGPRLPRPEDFGWLPSAEMTEGDRPPTARDRRPRGERLALPAAPGGDARRAPPGGDAAEGEIEVLDVEGAGPDSGAADAPWPAPLRSGGPSRGRPKRPGTPPRGLPRKGKRGGR